MDTKIEKDIEEYLKSAQDTNEVCERSLIVDAFIQLSSEVPNIKEAKRRLMQLISQGSGFVDPPSWVNL
jgi:hypothetical protein